MCYGFAFGFSRHAQNVVTEFPLAQRSFVLIYTNKSALPCRCWRRLRGPRMHNTGSGKDDGHDAQAVSRHTLMLAVDYSVEEK